MRVPMSLMFALGLAGIAAPAASSERATPEEKLAQATTGLVPGTAVNCFDRRRETGFVIAGDRLIFRAGARQVYVSQTRNGCMIRAGQSLVTRSTTSQICSGDAAEMLDPRTGFYGGTCVLGPFVPYKVAK